MLTHHVPQIHGLAIPVVASAPGAATDIVDLYARTRMADNDMTRRTRRTYLKPNDFCVFCASTNSSTSTVPESETP
jgi:hypothetical protein